MQSTVAGEAECLRSELTTYFEEKMAEFAARVQKMRSGSVELLEKKEKTEEGERSHDEAGRRNFQQRESLLTELLRVRHIRTIYNIFVALLIVFSITYAADQYVESGVVMFNFSIVTHSFGHLDVVLSVWILMMIFVCGAFFPFLLWASRESSSSSPSLVSRLLAVSLHVLLQSLFLYFPAHSVWTNRLPLASGMIILLEQIRLMMKMHSISMEVVFDRTEKSPSVSTFAYYLFAPTLVFRSEYPRRVNISWWSAVVHFANMVGCGFFIFFLADRYCLPFFRRAAEEGTLKSLLSAYVNCILPSALILVVGFFAFLHSWLNLFAELMRFGDRRFYADWWNAETLSSYWRDCNSVVYDWIYRYIYKPSLRIVGRQTAQIFSVELSAVVHEYVICLCLQNFYPVNMILFGGLSVILAVLTRNTKGGMGNMLFWLEIFVGQGILVSAIAVENYAREFVNASPGDWGIFSLRNGLSG